MTLRHLSPGRRTTHHVYIWIKIDRTHRHNNLNNGYNRISVRQFGEEEECFIEGTGPVLVTFDGPTNRPCRTSVHPPLPPRRSSVRQQYSLCPDGGGVKEQLKRQTNGPNFVLILIFFCWSQFKLIIAGMDSSAAPSLRTIFNFPFHRMRSSHSAAAAAAVGRRSAPHSPFRYIELLECETLELFG